jgi:hypothetical protein
LDCQFDCCCRSNDLSSHFCQLSQPFDWFYSLVLSNKISSLFLKIYQNYFRHSLLLFFFYKSMLRIQFVCSIFEGPSTLFVLDSSHFVWLSIFLVPAQWEIAAKFSQLQHSFRSSFTPFWPFHHHSLLLGKNSISLSLSFQNRTKKRNTLK